MEKEGGDIPIIEQILFSGKQNIPWKDVEIYLKQYIGNIFIVEKYQDPIVIGSDFPDEYTGSGYTKSLRGASAKAKANAVQIIGTLIGAAVNRRWIENKDNKHKKDASGGWYRYDAVFEIVVKGSQETTDRVNRYNVTLVVRKAREGLFLYDMINIKKEASRPLESK